MIMIRQSEYQGIQPAEPCYFAGLVLIILRPCQHGDGYIDVRSQIQVNTDEWTQVHSVWSSLVVTHPSTNRGRSALTVAVNVYTEL